MDPLNSIKNGSANRVTAHRVCLFPGLIDQLLDLRDVASKVILQLSDWLQLLQQPVGLVLQILHFSSCGVNCVELEEGQ